MIISLSGSGANGSMFLLSASILNLHFKPFKFQDVIGLLMSHHIKMMITCITCATELLHHSVIKKTPSHSANPLKFLVTLKDNLRFVLAYSQCETHVLGSASYVVFSVKVRT